MWKWISKEKQNMDISVMAPWTSLINFDDYVDQFQEVGLTLGVPWRHSNDSVDLGFFHGVYHSSHGQSVAGDCRKKGGREAKAGHDHIMSLEMSLQTVGWKNISLHHLDRQGRKQFTIVPFKLKK